MATFRLVLRDFLRKCWLSGRYLLVLIEYRALVLGEVRPGPEGGDPPVRLGDVEESQWTGGVARPEASQRQPQQPGHLQGLDQPVVSSNITEIIQQVQTGL